MGMQKRSDRYARGVDAIRTFGCLAIVCWHVYANGEFEFSQIANKLIHSWDYLVYLFMLLSGFGMFTGYYDKFKNRQIDIEEFYMKRYRKILPFFASIVLLGIVMNRTSIGLMDGIMDISLVYGLLPNNALSIIGVGWTLGTIFAFYICFPFFVFLIGSKKRAWFSFVASIVLQFMCNGYYMTERFVISSYRNRQNILFCAPFFIGGGILFLYRDEIDAWIGKKIGRYFTLVGCITATVLYFIIPNTFSILKLAELKLLIMYLLWMSFAIGTDSKIFINPFTHFISSISMEIYLSHMVSYRIVEKSGLLAVLGKSHIAYVLVISIVIGMTVAGSYALKSCINSGFKKSSNIRRWLSKAKSRHRVHKGN